MAYATKSYSRSAATSVFKGIGSGATYGGLPQLKIIHHHVTAPGSNKQSTYHFTLTEKVYAQLAVPELKEDAIPSLFHAGRLAGSASDLPRAATRPSGLIASESRG